MLGGDNQKMKSFIIVQVDYKYCNYLRELDDKVPFNSGLKRNRPFIGVLFKVEDVEYFVPLSSPKEKHKKMKNTMDFLKIDGGKLGAINYNNMIPVNNKCYKELNLLTKGLTESEYKYHHMLYLQLLWLNRNYEIVVKRAINLYICYKNNQLKKSIKDRCCNFTLLEEKCKLYGTDIVEV